MDMDCFLKKFNMRKIYKIITKILVFQIIGIFFYSNLAYTLPQERSLLLRTPLLFNIKFDSRPVNAGLLQKAFVMHDMTVKNVVNLHNDPKVAMYGGAGADISNFLLSTNARIAYFVSEYDGLLKSDLEHLIDYRGELNPDYAKGKFERSFACSAFVLKKEDILAGLAFELEAMGVDLSNVRVDLDNNRPRIQFEWAYPGTIAQTYSITFIDADITYPDKYIDVLSRGIDIYYQRASSAIPYAYKSPESFIYYIYYYLNEGGYFVTDDYALSMDPKIGIVDLGPKFPIHLNEAQISDSYRIENEILNSVLSSRNTAISETARLKYIGIEKDNPQLHYGWHVRIRQKCQANLRLCEKNYKSQKETLDRMNLDIYNAFVFLVRDYHCPLIPEAIDALKDRLMYYSQLRETEGSYSIAERNRILEKNEIILHCRKALLGQLKAPPNDWFISYFHGLPEVKIIELLRFMSNYRSIGNGQYFSGIINMTKGCSVMCDWCYADAHLFKFWDSWSWFAWPYLEEIADLIKQLGLRGPMIHFFDSDPLRDYYDPLYNKNYADVVSILQPAYITTAGFEIGSEGERAARRIKKEYPHIPIWVTITIESAWARKLGKENYIKTMRNVIDILKPNRIILRFSEKRDEAGRVFREIVGRDPEHDEAETVNKEGRAERLDKDRKISISDRSVHCVFGPIFEPDGAIYILSPEDNTFKTRLYRKIKFKEFQEESWRKVEEFLRTEILPEVPAIGDILNLRPEVNVSL